MSAFGRVRRSLGRGATKAGRAVTCGTRFQGLRPETQAVLVETASALPTPLPEFLIVVNQDEKKSAKQCHGLENDNETFSQIEHQQLFLITADAAAAVDATTGMKCLVFHRGITEGLLYQRSEDPSSNLYVAVLYHDEVMIQRSAMMLKNAFVLAGAQSIRSRIAHAGATSRSGAFKINGQFVGTGAGVEMNSRNADSTKDAGVWSESRVWAHQPFEMLPEDKRYFLTKLDQHLTDGPVTAALQDIVNEGKPVYKDFEVLVTHERTSEEVWNLSLKVAARFFPENRFEPGTGGGVHRSKSSSSTLEHRRELEVAFFTNLERPKYPPKAPPPDRIVSPLVADNHTELDKKLRPRVPNSISARNQVVVLVIGEKDAGKTSLIWTLMRAFDGLLGYPDESHNTCPDQGMQIRVDVGGHQRPGRLDSQATIDEGDVDDGDKPLAREGTTTDTVDEYKITEIQYTPKVKPAGVDGEKMVGELMMLDTEGLQLTSADANLQDIEVSALVDKWTDATAPATPQIFPDATILVFDGQALLEDHDERKGPQQLMFKRYRTLLNKSQRMLGVKHPVVVVLTRRDKVVARVEDDLVAGGALPDDPGARAKAVADAVEAELTRATEIVHRHLSGVDVLVFFVQNYVRPTHGEVTALNELQAEAVLDESAQARFLEKMHEWERINDGVLRVVRETLRRVQSGAFNDYVKKKTHEGPCKVQ